VDQRLDDESFWLASVEDRPEREGTRAGLSLAVNLVSCLRLLDWSARLFRTGKARMASEVADFLECLGSSSDVWRDRLARLRRRDRLYDVVFATSRALIHRFAETRGVTKLSNVTGCPD